MNFSEIQKIITDQYYPAFLLEDFISHPMRKKLKVWFSVITTILFLFSCFLYGQSHFLHSFVYSAYTSKVYALFILSCILWIKINILEIFFFSYYFKNEKETEIHIPFDLAYAIYQTSPENIVPTFFTSRYGLYILLRCGIYQSEFENFIKEIKNPIKTAFFLTPENNEISLGAFLVSVSLSDKNFSEFLFSKGIQDKELRAVGQWVTEIFYSIAGAEAWWSEENLSRIPSIGKAWSYGRAYTLEKHERMLPQAPRIYEVHSSCGVKELKEIEAVLSRKRDGNVLFVGTDEESMLEIISQLNYMIEEDKAVHDIQNSRVILLDTDLLISSHGSKTEFESTLISILKEAQHAGNIILVIQNLPAFITSSRVFGTDLPTMLEPYLSSPDMKVIALADTDRFHAEIEKNSLLMQHFETVQIAEVDEANTIKVLQNELIQFENKGFFFTYPAVAEIAESAERYFPLGVMPDKAIDLLVEMIPKLTGVKKYFVEKNDVVSLVEIKTGIPMGAMKDGEKDKLVHLEETLHSRVVGQEEAIKAIAGAVRRARSGVTSPTRPLGSFLFLGPTGVGKTETSKALADVFFGREANIIRLDMSEYSTSNAVEKLIGSFGNIEPGVLSNLLREHPYGVLLLDEFEKTTPEVMNLFLQILDEGFFSDNSGKKVNARNLIIIATSNAGSGEIWEAVSRGDELAQSKDVIIEAIIAQHIFKPELLNRFDGVVVFHPLKTEDMRKIAQFMLKKLASRLAERGMNLVINDELIEFLVKEGIDPKFGARPMNRAIQEKVEGIIAEKIINGEIKAGSQIALSTSDLNK